MILGVPPGRGPADEDPATQPTTQLTTQPMIRPVVIRRWVQAGLLPLALLGLWVLARAAGTLFLVIVIACLVGLIVAPPVRILERVMPRGLAIVTVYLAVAAVFVGVGFLLV